MLVQIDSLPNGQTLVEIDKITFASPLPHGGSRIHFEGPGYVDVPHSLTDLQQAITNVRAGRAQDDDGEGGNADA